jgi:hypothetical protein
MAVYSVKNYKAQELKSQFPSGLEPIISFRGQGTFDLEIKGLTAAEIETIAEAICASRR